MSGSVEASRLYLAAMFPSKRRVLGLDLTFLLDWKTWVWVSEFFLGGRRVVVDAPRKVLVSVSRCFVLFIFTVQGA